MSRSRGGRGLTPIDVPARLFLAREAAEEPVLFAFRSAEDRIAWIADGAAPIGPPRRWALPGRAARWIDELDRLEALARGDGWPVSRRTLLRMMMAPMLAPPPSSYRKK